MYTGIDPAAVAEMVKMAYYSIREGMTSFDQFLIVIKQAYVKKNFLISMADNFTPEELAAIKKAWQEAAGDVEKGLVKIGEEVKVFFDNKMVPIYRGGSDFKLRPNEYKVTPGGTFPARGISVNADPLSIAQFGPKKILYLPEELQIIFTPSKKLPAHHDIIPKDVTISEEAFQNLLNKIETE